jgi:hypothetical protein
VGPLQYLALQLEDEALREPDIESALQVTIPINAASAFAAGGQHAASLWLLRVIEVAAVEIGRLSARRIARLTAARPNNFATEATDSDGLISDLRERLKVLRRFEPGLADRVDDHVQRIDELLRSP